MKLSSQRTTAKQNVRYQPQDRDDAAVLGEVANGLQTAMNYLVTASRASRSEGSDPPIDPALIEKAMEQLARAAEAYRALHTLITRAARQNPES